MKKAFIMRVILAQRLGKKGLLLFDYACHSCSETMKKAFIMRVILAQRPTKKGLLLFDYACHSCSETMLIFSVYLSVCLMSDHEGPANKDGIIKIYIAKNIFSRYGTS